MDSKPLLQYYKAITQRLSWRSWVLFWWRQNQLFARSFRKVCLSWSRRCKPRGMENTWNKQYNEEFNVNIKKGTFMSGRISPHAHNSETGYHSSSPINRISSKSVHRDFCVFFHPFNSVVVKCVICGQDGPENCSLVNNFKIFPRL